MSIIAMIRKGKSVGSTKTESMNSFIKGLVNSPEVKGEVAKQYANKIVDSIFAREEARRLALKEKAIAFDSLPVLGKVSFESNGKLREYVVKLDKDKEGKDKPVIKTCGFKIHTLNSQLSNPKVGATKIVKSWETLKK